MSAVELACRCEKGPEVLAALVERAGVEWVCEGAPEEDGDVMERLGEDAMARIGVWRRCVEAAVGATGNASRAAVLEMLMAVVPAALGGRYHWKMVVSAVEVLVEEGAVEELDVVLGWGVSAFRKPVRERVYRVEGVDGVCEVGPCGDGVDGAVGDDVDAAKIAELEAVLEGRQVAHVSRCLTEAAKANCVAAARFFLLSKKLDASHLCAAFETALTTTAIDAIKVLLLETDHHKPFVLTSAHADKIGHTLLHYSSSQAPCRARWVAGTVATAPLPPRCVAMQWYLDLMACLASSPRATSDRLDVLLRAVTGHRRWLNDGSPRTWDEYAPWMLYLAERRGMSVLVRRLVGDPRFVMSLGTFQNVFPPLVEKDEVEAVEWLLRGCGKVRVVREISAEVSAECRARGGIVVTVQGVRREVQSLFHYKVTKEMDAVLKSFE
ncbi:hypothetical protein HDU96_001249 [Phlyctochytrium bullatum]|nr:hypothetical protein HDU96_001249 [Phlyctochytrium bullatum]